MDVLSPLDTAFLRLETSYAHLHIASASVFEGPCPDFPGLMKLLGERMTENPRCTQRVREAPFGLAMPVWIEDENFDLTEHVRLRAVPAPGGLHELHELVSWFMSEPLDLDRSPWEIWVVEGLEDGHWAVVVKVHHCMLDGIGGTDLLARVFDGRETGSAPHPSDDNQHHDKGWRTRVPAVGRPNFSLAPLRSAVEITRLAVPRTGTTLAGSIGHERTWATTKANIDELRLVRAAFGGTINDVCLTIIARGYRDLLIHRGIEPSGHRVRTLVPVSARPAGKAGNGASSGVDGNLVTALIAELPVDIEDPVERLAATRNQLRRLKGSGEAAVGSGALTLLQFVPAPLLNRAMSVFFRLPQRVITTVTTNVPGPTIPLRLAGRRLLELYPYVPIAFQLRTGVAMTSYDGTLFFGVTADRDSTPDVDVLLAGIDDGLAELLKAAAEHLEAARDRGEVS